MRRRTYLATALSTVLVLGGCSATSSLTRSTVTPTETSTEPTTGSPPTRTTTEDCTSMHENVIRVEFVRDNVGDDYVPIPFSELTAGEREILETAVEDGGFTNCEVTDPFRRFVERVMTHREEQEDILVYLAYEGEYYGLYVQQGDMVFSSD